MGLFSRKKNVPVMPAGEHDPVLRCSICTGEQVLCVQDRNTGELTELMLIRSPRDLEDFCEMNSLDPGSIRKIY